MEHVFNWSTLVVLSKNNVQWKIIILKIVVMKLIVIKDIKVYINQMIIAFMQGVHILVGIRFIQMICNTTLIKELN